MPETCTHLDTIQDVTPSSPGCEDCLRIGAALGAPAVVHELRARRLLRLLAEPARDGALPRTPSHPLIRSYEPGEEWWYCYPDDLAFELDGGPPSLSHP